MSRKLLSLFLASLLLAAACGEEGGPPDGVADGGGGGFPVTLELASGSVTIEARPERIVSVSPTSTEVLFAIGAGDRVVAVDDQSNHPPEAPTTDLSGFEPNVEAIADNDPDLVVYSTDPGELGASLEALGIAAVQHDAATTFEDAYTQITQLGEATGNLPQAEQLVARMQSDIDDLSASVPELAQTPTYYHELDDTFFTVTSQTFIGEVYALAGLENIADAAEDAASQYPQLSAEFILDTDPDLVFLADTKCCDITAESVAGRPGWSELTAVQTGSVIELDDDIASRWGPRVVEFLEVVVAAVGDLEEAA